MAQALQSTALDQLFRAARTYNGWLPTAIADETVRELYDTLKWGATSANSNPARFVWVRSAEGKAQLASMAAEANRPKILAAPLTVIVGNDLDFSALLPKLLPPTHIEKMQALFSDAAMAETTAMRNGSLQGAYLMLAARALGLDCGPMSGFNHEAVDKAFFAGTNIRSNFICNLGYGDAASLHPRLPRLSFDEAGRFA
jgi:3-hydroxypropanoate dehydrogenase